MEKTVITAAKRGDVTTLRRVLPLAEYPFYYQWNNPLSWAANNNHLEAFTVLLFDNNFRQMADLDGCLAVAAERGCLDIVDFILKYTDVDPTANGNDALVSAYTKGQTAVVERLLKDARVRGYYTTPFIS